MKGEHGLVSGKSKCGAIMALVASRAQRAKNDEAKPQHPVRKKGSK